MSIVTTVIVILSWDPDGETLKAISEFKGNSLGIPLEFGVNVCEGPENLNDPQWKGVDRYIGGYKMAECDIYIGAWNHFDHEGFLAHLKTVPWPSPEDSCVVIQSCDLEFVEVFRPDHIER